MVDEVHERCTEVDLLLLVLAKALSTKRHGVCMHPLPLLLLLLRCTESAAAAVVQTLKEERQRRQIVEALCKQKKRHKGDTRVAIETLETQRRMKKHGGDKGDTKETAETQREH